MTTDTPAHGDPEEQPPVVIVRTRYRDGMLKLTDRRLLFLFVAFLLLFGGLAYKQQGNTEAIRRHAHDQALHNWDQCQRSVTNTIKINTTDQAFIDFLDPFVKRSANPESLRNFIAIYQAAKLNIPDCGPRP